MKKINKIKIILIKQRGRFQNQVPTLRVLQVFLLCVHGWDLKFFP